MNTIRPIRTEDDYDWALAQVAPYFELEPDLGSEDSDRFLILVDLISVYEARHYPMPEADPISTILYAMDVKGRTQKDLAALFGSKSHASEVLRRKRRLNLSYVHKLHKEWGIPLEALVNPYPIEEAAKSKKHKKAA